MLRVRASVAAGRSLGQAWRSPVRHQPWEGWHRLMSDSASKKGPKPNKKITKASGNGVTPENFRQYVLMGLGAAVTVKLGQYLYGEPATHGNFQDFRNDCLASGKVHKINVTNLKRVVARDSNDTVVADFEIGSVDTFLQQIEHAQSELGVDEADFIPITYNNGIEARRVIMLVAPTMCLIAFWVYNMRSMTGGSGPAAGLLNIGKAKTAKARQDITTKFHDVAGMDEAKLEIMEFVDFLKNPERYQKLGAKVPKGLLLVGPPGTGKTLLAKATAGEASVPFFTMAGSDFIEMFAGVGPSRVRDLFKQARENLPAIIFIDEIDAIGRKRGASNRGGHDERENTLNQLLVEMDGFQSEKGVVVMASTNRPDVLDPALLRPGRFDRRVEVDRPDVKGRYDIFLVHLKSIKVHNDAEMKELAKRLATLTPGFVGADIANICNEAALIAARDKAKVVALIHFERAIERVIAGMEKKERLLSPDEKRTVAYHEAGHAVCGWYLDHADPLLKVSIIPRGSSTLGYAQYIPKDVLLLSTEELLDRMCMTLGGRVAESLTFGRITTGAQDDLQRVTRSAYEQVSLYGLNDTVGLVSFPRSDDVQFVKPFSEETSELMDKEVRELVERAYVRTEELLKSKQEELVKVAEYLIEKEVMGYEEMTELIGPRPGGGDTNEMYREVNLAIEKVEAAKEKEREDLRRKATEQNTKAVMDGFDEKEGDEDEDNKDEDNKDEDNKDEDNKDEDNKEGEGGKTPDEIEHEPADDTPKEEKTLEKTP